MCRAWYLGFIVYQIDEIIKVRPAFNLIVFAWNTADEQFDFIVNTLTSEHSKKDFTICSGRQISLPAVCIHSDIHSLQNYTKQHKAIINWYRNLYGIHQQHLHKKPISIYKKNIRIKWFVHLRYRPIKKTSAYEKALVFLL